MERARQQNDSLANGHHHRAVADPSRAGAADPQLIVAVSIVVMAIVLMPIAHAVAASARQRGTRTGQPRVGLAVSETVILLTSPLHPY